MKNEVTMLYLEAGPKLGTEGSPGPVSGYSFLATVLDSDALTLIVISVAEVICPAVSVHDLKGASTCWLLAGLMQTKQEPRIGAGTPYFLIGPYNIPPCDSEHIYRPEFATCWSLCLVFLSAGTKKTE
jgi:hypothetical protein